MTWAQRAALAPVPSPLWRAGLRTSILTGYQLTSVYGVHLPLSVLPCATVVNSIARFRNVSSTPIKTRSERANLLRKHVRDLVEDSSFRQAAAVIGVSVGAIRSLLDGGTPLEHTLELLESWATRSGHITQTVPEVAPEIRWLPNEVIGEKIEEIRKRAGKSQHALAEYLGMPKGQPEISRWERGRLRPSFERLHQIAALEGMGAEIFQVGGRYTPRPQLMVHESAPSYSPRTPDIVMPSALVRHIIRFLVADLGYSPTQLKHSSDGVLIVQSPEGRILLEVKAPRFSQQGRGALAAARDQEDPARTQPPEPLPDTDPRYHSAAESDEAVSISESIPPAPAPAARPDRAEQGVPHTSRIGTTSRRRRP